MAVALPDKVHFVSKLTEQYEHFCLFIMGMQRMGMAVSRQILMGVFKTD